MNIILFSNKDIQKSGFTLIMSYNKCALYKLKMKKNLNHRMARSSFFYEIEKQIRDFFAKDTES